MLGQFLSSLTGLHTLVPPFPSTDVLGYCRDVPSGTQKPLRLSEMFNRYAIGVRAHADGVGVKRQPFH